MNIQKILYTIILLSLFFSFSFAKDKSNLRTCSRDGWHGYISLKADLIEVQLAKLKYHMEKVKEKTGCFASSLEELLEYSFLTEKEKVYINEGFNDSYLFKLLESGCDFYTIITENDCGLINYQINNSSSSPSYYFENSEDRKRFINVLKKDANDRNLKGFKRASSIDLLSAIIDNKDYKFFIKLIEYECSKKSDSDPDTIWASSKALNNLILKSGMSEESSKIAFLIKYIFRIRVENKHQCSCYDLAIKELLEVLDKFQKDEQTNLILKEIYQQLNDDDNLKKYFESAIDGNTIY